MARWLIILLPLQCFGQSALTTGMGLADAAIDGAFTSNPAANPIGAHLSFDHPFLMSEFGMLSAAAGVENWQFRADRQGDRVWNVTSFSVARSQQLGHRTSLGISGGLNTERIRGTYPHKSSTIIFSVGFRSEVSEKVAIGAAFHDMQSFESGVAFRSSEKFTFTFEVDKHLRQRPVYRFGLLLHPADRIIITGGWFSSPSVPAFGFGWRSSNWSIVIASTHHPWLGFTPSISIVYAPLD